MTNAIVGWTADKIGRKKGVAIGAVFSLLGSALMAGSVNSDMVSTAASTCRYEKDTDPARQFICARIIAGIGIGFINTIIPSWVSELSSAHNRGSIFALVFVANYLGIVIAYWINFGIRNFGAEFRWRFPLGFMAVFMLIVLVTVPLLPESPRSAIPPNIFLHFPDTILQVVDSKPASCRSHRDPGQITG
jgi:MFS family permease